MSTKPPTNFPVGMKVSLRKYFRRCFPNLVPVSYTGVVIGVAKDYIEVEAKNAQKVLNFPDPILCLPSELSRARGFASLSPERLREIAAKGGRNVPSEKRAFSTSSSLAQQAGAKGGKVGGKAAYKNSRGAGSHE